MVDNALANNVTIYRKTFTNENYILDELSKSVQEVAEFLKSIHKTVKYYISLKVNFCKSTDPTNITDHSVVFNSESFTNLEGDELVANSEISYNQILKQIDTYECNGSEQVLLEFVTLDIVLVSYNPLRGSSYKQWGRKTLKRR